MPRYLRWIASTTAGIVVQFALSVLGAALAVESERTAAGEQVVRVTPAVALIQLAATLGAIVVALAVNDWLARRYPTGSPSGSPPAG